MAYSLQFHHERVILYLRNREGLSRQARVRVFAILDADLRNQGDIYANDPTRRLAPDSPCFWFNAVLRDIDGDGRIHRFWFIVNTAAAAYGILRLEYVEEHVQA